MLTPAVPEMKIPVTPDTVPVLVMAPANVETFSTTMPVRVALMMPLLTMLPVKLVMPHEQPTTITGPRRDRTAVADVADKGAGIRYGNARAGGRNRAAAAVDDIAGEGAHIIHGNAGGSSDNLTAIDEASRGMPVTSEAPDAYEAR